MNLNEDLIPLLNKAFFYLKFRPRSIKEVREYLYKKIRTTHWSREAADAVIDNLLERKILDDLEFTGWFVRQRTALKPKSQRLLTTELRQKGVSDEIIEKYFGDNEVDEEKLAMEILEKRWPRFKSLDSRKRFEKATRFLMSRGYSYDLIKRTISKLENI